MQQFKITIGPLSPDGIASSVWMTLSIFIDSRDSFSGSWRNGTKSSWTNLLTIYTGFGQQRQTRFILSQPKRVSSFGSSCIGLRDLILMWPSTDNRRPWGQETLGINYSGYARTLYLCLSTIKFNLTCMIVSGGVDDYYKGPQVIQTTTTTTRTRCVNSFAVNYGNLSIEYFKPSFIWYRKVPNE